MTLHGGKMDTKNLTPEYKLATPYTLEDMNDYMLANASNHNGSPKKLIFAYKIPSNSKIKILKQLNRLGINESSLFRDKDHLSGFLKRSNIEAESRTTSITLPLSLDNGWTPD